MNSVRTNRTPLLKFTINLLFLGITRLYQNWRWGRDLLNTLSEMNIMYDVLLLPRMNASRLNEYCKKYKTILVPDIPWMSTEQEDLMRDYKVRGGKIYTIGSSQSLQNLSQINSPAAMMENIAEKENKDELYRNLTKLSGEPVISIENASYIMSNIVKKKDSDRYIIHIVNYSDQVENVRVTINLDDEEGVKIKALTLYSPDQVENKLIMTSIKGKRAHFTIPKLHMYAVVVIN